MEPKTTDRYTVVISSDDRRMVQHLDRSGEMIAIYYSESDEFTAENAEALLSSYDVPRNGYEEVSAEEFDNILSNFQNLIREYRY